MIEWNRIFVDRFEIVKINRAKLRYRIAIVAVFLARRFLVEQTGKITSRQMTIREKDRYHILETVRIDVLSSKVKHY